MLSIASLWSRLQTRQAPPHRHRWGPWYINPRISQYVRERDCQVEKCGAVDGR